MSADSAETSYKSFIKSNDIKEGMKAFTLCLRIDTLYMELLKTHIELREVAKIVLIMAQKCSCRFLKTIFKWAPQAFIQTKEEYIKCSKQVSF